MNSGKAILGIVTALAVGTAIGILMAPDKGSKIRSRIMKKGEGYLDDARDAFDDLLDQVMEKFDCTRKEAEDIISKGRKKYQEAKDII